MLKKRLIPKFLLRDDRLVKYTRFFDNERIAGNPVTTAKVYNDYGVDELIVLDIVPSEASRGRVVDIIERMSEEIFMPFTVGGGVKRLEDVNMLLRAGADKVSVNSEAVRRPEFVRDAARVFGGPGGCGLPAAWSQLFGGPRARGAYCRSLLSPRPQPAHPAHTWGPGRPPPPPQPKRQDVIWANSLSPETILRCMCKSSLKP